MSSESLLLLLDDAARFFARTIGVDVDSGFAATSGLAGVAAAFFGVSSSSDELDELSFFLLLMRLAGGGMAALGVAKVNQNRNECFNNRQS